MIPIESLTSGQTLTLITRETSSPFLRSIYNGKMDINVIYHLIVGYLILLIGHRAVLKAQGNIVARMSS